MGYCPDGRNISISRVLHKTHIDVDGLGTKAGAATVVEMCKETAMVEQPERINFRQAVFICDRGEGHRYSGVHRNGGELLTEREKAWRMKKIIALYWDRDQTAIAETQQKYGRYCGSIAHNIVHDAQDAEECVNDTWMRAWNSMPRERPHLLAAFLGAITRNLSLDCYRRKHSEKRGGGVMPDIYEELHDCAGGEEPLTQIERKELAASINRFLEGLDRESRIIFMRRYWYMDSIGAIAGRLAVSESKVKSSLYRSRGKLRIHLEREGLLS